MLNKKDIDYFNFGKLENEKFWRRLGGKPDLKNKTVLDFGCGHGALCVDIAKSGAKIVNGIDLEENLLKFAKDNLKENYKDLRLTIDEPEDLELIRELVLNFKVDINSSFC